MKGRIVNYRGGRRTQYTNQFVIVAEGSSSKEDAAKLMGNKVEWTTPSGKKISGTVTRVHGNKGAIVARFEKGLPGQALGTEVEIFEK
jgi:large subunit ribosomal protein L35Ae